MKIEKNKSLKDYNTFGIDVSASQFASVTSIEELQAVLKKDKDVFVLSGGSNMLLTNNIDRLTLHVALKGIEVIKETENHAFIECQAGENWHDFVLWCIENNYGGLENLSLIPGNVGTSPIQNIGAYGVEIKDTFQELEALEIETGKLKKFTLEMCEFGYRNSVFKNELKGKFIITSVVFKLTKNEHKLNFSYGAIKDELAKNNISTPTIRSISNAVINIRNSKLPNPKEIGNSGSFFKNPVISIELFEKIKRDYPNVPSYPISDTEIKVPAGWLIEQSGFKGKRFGDAGVHTKQALVLVNYGDAKGEEIHKLAKKIQATIKENFGISLEIEVNVI